MLTEARYFDLTGHMTGYEYTTNRMSYDDYLSNGRRSTLPTSLNPEVPEEEERLAVLRLQFY
jgi:hypothetical protein